jgi:hypothetical protein
VVSASDPPTAKYLNSSAVVWDLRSLPAEAIGRQAANADRLNLNAPEFPFVTLTPGAPHAVFTNYNGVQNELEVWFAPNGSTSRPDAPWQLLAARADDVTQVRLRGHEVFLLSHHEAPTFKVLVLRTGQKLSQAEVASSLDCSEWVRMVLIQG